MLKISLQESLELKGIALLMLLIHHLFYIQHGKYDDIAVLGNAGLVQLFGIACKACVPLFVFLSGYGLAVSNCKDREFSYSKFYKNRFSKLLFNYWFIWLIFVPIGILCFERDFESVYGNHLLLKFGLDIFGVLNCTGLYGYNPTWWFMSCIILLYLLFPLIIKVYNSPNHKLVFGMIISSILLIFIPFRVTEPIRYYLITFIIGVFFGNIHSYSKLPPPISCNPQMSTLISSIK